MTGNSSTHCIAFSGTHRIASGTFGEVATAAKRALDNGFDGTILFFDDSTSQQIEIDLRGSEKDVAGRIAVPDVEEGDLTDDTTDPTTSALRGPGRPKLGVVAREVTLLPRHWNWLSEQSGGASVALRKLVDEAKRVNESRDRTRAAQDSAYRFISVMAGDQPGFEEATRALFASNQHNFERNVEAWPVDVREHAVVLASRAFGASRFKNV